jgi:hypothetical protein
MLLIYSKAGVQWTGSDEDVEIMRATLELEKELAASGELISAEGLAIPEDATIVRIRDGVPVVTDGPFAEAKEHLAGYFLLECASRDRAVEIAARMPPAKTHAVELRPLFDKAAMWEMVKR